jgi:hypothetical protein
MLYNHVPSRVIQTAFDRERDVMCQLVNYRLLALHEVFGYPTFMNPRGSQ